MELKDLLTQNKHLSDMRARVKFFRDSYNGGAGYREGGYLLQHARESDEAFEGRLKTSVFPNKCASVVDLYINYIFREKIVRDLPFKGWAFDAYMNDADFNLNSHETLMRELSRQASIMGLVGIIIDKPQSEAQTAAHEQDAGVRPYVTTYTVDNIINYEFKRINGRPTLTTLVLRETEIEASLGDVSDMDIYRVWTLDEWFVYGVVDGKVEEATLLESGSHVLGEIPFILVKNRGFGSKFTGRSDLSDIADLNYRMFKHDSNIDEVYESSAYPMLEVPQGTGDVVGGVGNVIEFDPDNPQARHAYIEPNHSSALVMRQTREDIIADILSISKTGAENQSGQVKSAHALEIEGQQLNAILSEKAENMERVENQLFRLFGKWQGVDEVGMVSYPRKFGVRDLSTDLDNSIKAMAIVASRKYAAEVGSNVAARTLPFADAQTLDEINKELDQPPMDIALNA